MGFIVRNDGFLCAHCGKKNTPAQKTCRNHCQYCLWSQHVDEKFPGDRTSSCGGDMPPVAVEMTATGDCILVHSCCRCQKIIRNKTAADDNQDEMVRIAQKKAEKQKKIKF